MKLNVRSQSHIAITPSSQSMIETATPSTHLLSTGTQTERPRRNCLPVYLLLVVVLMSTPFVLPLLKKVRMDMQSQVRASSRGVAHKPGRGEHRGEDWSNWAVIRNGRIYISESLENRLNARAKTLYNRLSSRFHRCTGGADIAFALNRGGGIKGWVEVVTKCGYGTCTRRSEVDDIRSLVIRRERRGHYISSGGRVWGPLRGPLKVGLHDEASLPLRSVCRGEVETVLVDVGFVTSLLGHVDEFRFDVRDGGVGLGRMY